jgi:hypothetical protein
MSKESHIPDADLILAVDGEMSMLRKSQIHSHLVHLLDLPHANERDRRHDR